MPVWIGMMIRTEDGPEPAVVQFTADIWDRRLGLLPVLDRLFGSPNVLLIRIIRADDEAAALASMTRHMTALNRRVSSHMAKFDEYLHYCKTHEQAEKEREAKAYRVTPERIHEIDTAMKAADGVAKMAARALGMPSSTLHYYLKRKELRHWRAIKNERAEHAARILQIY